MSTRPLIYGEASSKTINMPLGASEVFKDLAGHFVVPDSSGRVQLANATDVNIIGWALQGERTSSATEGADFADVDTDLGKIWEIPAVLNDGTAPTDAQLKAAVGETCDIKLVSTNYQYANINTSSVDILQILGWVRYNDNVGGQSVFVRVNIEKIVNTGVA